MPKIDRRSLSLIPALVLLAGCASMDGAGADEAMWGAEDVELGQTVLFVGTDPVTLETDLFLARALADEGEPPPSLLDAADFGVEALGIVAAGEAAGLFGSGTDLFSNALPYAIPDRDGRRIGLVSTPNSLEDPSLPVGRAGVFDLDTGALQVTGDLPGLAGLHFSSDGAFVFLSSEDAEGQPISFRIVRSDSLTSDPWDNDGIFGLPADSQVHLAGSVRGSDDFLVVARPEGGNAAVYRIDPMASQATLLSGAETGNVTSPALSPSGTLMAATVSGYDSTVRTLVLFDLVAGTAETVSDPTAADCSWPAWSPREDRLVFVCQSLATQRPDIALWPPDESTSVAGYLTDRAQPAIVGGSMEGQVVRSRPQWDPQGDFVVFGASSADEVEGDMTLLVLPLGSSVFPIYQAPQGSVGWAHFSARSDSGELLVWDRGTTGLQASNGQHPIRVVATDSPNPTPRGVDLGQDLLVSYPLFLGENTMLYP